MPTSKERREVAKRLRHMADAHDATEASRVARALELEYKVYGTVVAFDSADIRNLADLIDQTCDAEQDYDRDEPIQGRWWKCDVCGEHFIYERGFAPRFCPECGARVVNE